MKLELFVIPELLGGPEQPLTYALVLQLTRDGHPQGPPSVLQRGYKAPEDALAALLDCLTFAPPDMTIYDEATAHIAGLLDRNRDLEAAMVQLGQRLVEVETRLLELAAGVPPPPAGNRFVPPKVNESTIPASPAGHRPAPIRQAQPPRRTMLSAGFGAGGKVSGRGAMEITGGVGRPGDLGPTGTGADTGLDET